MKYTPIIILSFIFFLLPVISIAQYNIKEGPELLVKKNAKFDRVIGSDNDAFYVFRIKSKGSNTTYFVEKYNKKSLELIFSRNLNIEESNEFVLDNEIIHTYTILTGDKIYVIFPIFNKKLNKRSIALKEIRIDGELIRGMIDLDAGQENTHFSLEMSPDNSKFIIVRTKEDKNMADLVHLKLFNTDDLKVQWEQELPNNYKDSGIERLGYAINNNGLFSVFFLYMDDFEKNQISASVAVIDGLNNNSITIDLELDKRKMPYNMSVKYAEGNRLVCMGVFKDSELTKSQVKDKRITRRAGIYYYVLNLNKMIVSNQGAQYFPSSIVEQLTYSNLEGFYPGDKVYSSSKIYEIDESYYHITEHGYNIDGIDESMMRRELIVSKINKSNGTLEWSRLLQKNSSNRNGMYNVVLKDGSLNIFCLENEKAQKSFDKGKAFEAGKFPMANTLKGCNVRAYKVHEDGKVENFIIYKNIDFAYEPQYAEVFLKEDNELLVYLLQGDREKFGILEVQ